MSKNWVNQCYISDFTNTVKKLRYAEQKYYICSLQNIIMYNKNIKMTYLGCQIWQIMSQKLLVWAWLASISYTY